MRTIEYIDRNWVYYDSKQMRVEGISIKMDMMYFALGLVVGNVVGDNVWAYHYFKEKKIKVAKLKKAYGYIMEVMFWL